MKNEKGTNYKLFTEAGERLKGCEKVWQKYPRPQLRRANWQTLNGIWELDGHSIRVPFPPESILAEYEGLCKEHMTYTKVFEPKYFDVTKRTLLHFQAVDQVADVYLNDIFLGRHEGGYLPFSFDISKEITEKDNLLVVKVIDELNKDYPYGKQCKNRGGMWYTPISGIWQSVWLEQVPKHYITGLKITPDLQGIHLEIKEDVGPCKIAKVTIHLHNGEVLKANVTGGQAYIDLSKHRTEDDGVYEPKIWSQSEPYLYRMVVETKEDRVESYFALRTIDIEKVLCDGRETECVCLNGEPVFMHGVLDQGYFSDGIYTPAEEEEYERDVLRMKELGFNMLRKHIKIEPECFYYYCDKHGMLVMQDMVNNGDYNFVMDTALPTIGIKKYLNRRKRITQIQKEFFERHMLDTLEHLHNHPCIIAYTIFNEGWGQFEADKMYAIAKKADPGRLYDATSGWFAERDSDFDSVHIYFGTKKPVKKDRPVLLSEFGGYSYLVDDHVFSANNYGYGTCRSEDELWERIYRRYTELVVPYVYVETGLCGSIYTQLSDVEDEINGLYTYDRKVCKVNKEKMQHLAEALYRWQLKR
ncbi:MAG: hypothetical protein IKK33_08255 [Lachnospiraceae bacterium]|nr:hypothetical protein [Lachnospiraceae bacterium]